jgi:hypothetical protein
MKKILVALAIFSLSIIAFEINSEEAQAATNVQCIGGRSRVCANVREPDGTWHTYVGTVGIVTYE